MIRALNLEDWPAVKAIYVQGIKTGIATFVTECNVTTYENWSDSKVENSGFVFEENNEILGWACLSKISSRCAYTGVAEVSVYIDSKAKGKGIGSKLLAQLITFSESNDFWTLQASIFTENTVSIALHEKYGFAKVGIRKKIGKLNEEWKDNLLMERRSEIVGI